VLLALVKPVWSDEAKFLDKVDARFLDFDHRLNFKDQPKLADRGETVGPPTDKGSGEGGGGAFHSSSSEVEAGGGDCADGGEVDDDGDDDDEAAMLAAALALSMAPHADPGFFPDGFFANGADQVLFPSSSTSQACDAPFPKDDSKWQKQNHMILKPTCPLTSLWNSFINSSRRKVLWVVADQQDTSPFRPSQSSSGLRVGRWSS
jgi:hypothetical protein